MPIRKTELPPFEQIRRDYHPDLTDDDLKACLRFVRNVMGAEEIHLKQAI